MQRTKMVRIASRLSKEHMDMLHDIAMAHRDELGAGPNTWISKALRLAIKVAWDHLIARNQ